VLVLRKKSSLYHCKCSVVSACYASSPVHTGDRVEFNTVDFVQTRQSRPCCFGPVHTGNKVDRSGNKVDRIGNRVDRVDDSVDRDKLSNSSCCRIVAKTGNKVDRIGYGPRDFVAGFGNSRLRRQCVPGFSL